MVRFATLSEKSGVTVGWQQMIWKKKIKVLQAGEERRGSCASQSNGCCFDPANVEQVLAFGAVRAGHYIQAMQEELIHQKIQGCSEAYPEATVREGADESTLRADEVARSGPSSTHSTLKLRGGNRPLVDANWHAFCQAMEKEWEGLYCHYRDMSEATGAQKSSESQKKRKPSGQ